MHYPKVLDIDGINEILSRKCSKCYLGPFNLQEDLLAHIGLRHGEMVEAWAKKVGFDNLTYARLDKTQEPLKKVI